MVRVTRPIERINDKTTLAECKDGFWLYDENRGMNLSMRADSEKAALIEALEYYQRRMIEVESNNKRLKLNISNFLDGLGIEDYEILD